jgi:hypothetical protein
VSEDQDYSGLEAPLNMAMEIIAEREGIEWHRTIKVTKDIKPGEFHVGEKICKIHPLTVVSTPILTTLQHFIKLSRELHRRGEQAREEAVRHAMERVLEDMKYLSRALKNGKQFTLFDFYLSLSDIITYPSEKKEIEDDNLNADVEEGGEEALGQV